MKTLEQALPDIQKHFDFDIQLSDNEPHQLTIYHNAYWGANDKEAYDKQVEFLDSMIIENGLFKIWCWCDISGYDYWMLNMKETNYVSIDVFVKKNLLSERDILFIMDQLTEVDTQIWENMNTSFFFDEEGNKLNHSL